MADVLMVLTFVAFIALCVVYVWWCDRIIGPDPVHADVDDEVGTLAAHEVAA